MSNTWNKIKKETSLSYEWFCRYRAMGPRRTIESLSTKFEKKDNYRQVLYIWSAQHGWVNRAKDYDVHCDEVKLAARERLLEEQTAQHLRVASLALTLGIERMPDLMASDDLTAKDAMGIMKDAIKIRRDEMGVGGEKLEITQKVDKDSLLMAKLNVEAIARAEKLLGAKYNTVIIESMESEEEAADA